MSDEKVVLNQEEIQEVNEEVSLAVEEAEKDTVVSDILTLSTGYVVKLITIPDALYMKIYNRFPEPTPPMIDRIDGGKTFQEPNPDDPQYEKDLLKHNKLLSEAVSRAEALKGVEIISAPETAYLFDDDKEWMEELEAIGIPVPEKSSRSARYIEWFLYRVAPSWSDSNAIQDVRIAMRGLSEEEVEATEATFQDPS